MTKCDQCSDVGSTLEAIYHSVNPFDGITVHVIKIAQKLSSLHNFM